jgi:hypothetical protein
MPRGHPNCPGAVGGSGCLQSTGAGGRSDASVLRAGQWLDERAGDGTGRTQTGCPSYAACCGGTHAYWLGASAPCLICVDHSGCGGRCGRRPPAIASSRHACYRCRRPLWMPPGSLRHHRRPGARASALVTLSASMRAGPGPRRSKLGDEWAASMVLESMPQGSPLHFRVN